MPGALLSSHSPSRAALRRRRPPCSFCAGRGSLLGWFRGAVCPGGACRCTSDDARGPSTCPAYLALCTCRQGHGDRMFWKPCHWAFGPRGALGPEDACSDLRPSHPLAQACLQPSLGSHPNPAPSWPECRGTGGKAALGTALKRAYLFVFRTGKHAWTLTNYTVQFIYVLELLITRTFGHKERSDNLCISRSPAPQAAVSVRREGRGGTGVPRAFVSGPWAASKCSDRG